MQKPLEVGCDQVNEVIAVAPALIASLLQSHVHLHFVCCEIEQTHHLWRNVSIKQYKQQNTNTKHMQTRWRSETKM